MKYFPEQFNFFPQTYLLPEDLDIVKQKLKEKKSILISKPSSGG